MMSAVALLPWVLVASRRTGTQLVVQSLPLRVPHPGDTANLALPRAKVALSVM